MAKLSSTQVFGRLNVSEEIIADSIKVGDEQSEVYHTGNIPKATTVQIDAIFS